MTWNNRFEGQWKSSTFSLVLIISNAINFLFSLNESKKELRAVNPSQVLICRRPLLSPICPLDTSHAPGQRVRHNHLTYFSGYRNVGDLVSRTYEKLIEKNTDYSFILEEKQKKNIFGIAYPMTKMDRRVICVMTFGLSWKLSVNSVRPRQSDFTETS